MTETLYLTDAYQKEAQAKIIKIGETADHQTFVILDQTIMYPMGGGQPSDKGEIVGESGSLKVKQVDYNGGEIKHVGKLTGKLAAGDEVRVTIDWDLRYKHMQLHTAGHAVDMIVRNLYPKLIPTRGMHGIGKQLFVEYEGINEVSIEKINQAIVEAINSNIAINTHFTTLEELKKIANWLPPKLPSSKKLRVLSIGDKYHIPDGGTQLKSTNELWPTVVTKIVQVEGNTQIHYQVTESRDKGETINITIHDRVKITDNMSASLAEVREQFLKDNDKITNLEEIEQLRIKYLSKANGLTTKLLQQLPKLSPEDKKSYGPILNSLKKTQEQVIETKISELKIKESNQKEDLTIPHPPRLSGRLHPTTIVIRELNEFFRSQGFSIQEGPEIETPEYNFRRLNLPEGHPATDLQDTLYIHEPDLLMRTHTSSIQTRVLSSFKPPMRVVVPGKVYRNENKSSTNSSFFYQYQGFVVDKGVNIQNLKEMLTRAHQFLFGNDVVLRFRYKYYPEVSPGMGVDMQCRFCHGKGCQVCKYRGWIETLGSGMTHYNCYKSCGIDPEVWTGYSFGLGLDRLVMNKFGIDDIRKLYSGELAYL